MKIAIFTALLATVSAIAIPQPKPTRTSDLVLNSIRTFQRTSGQRFVFLTTLIASSRSTIDSITVPENYQLTIVAPADEAFTNFPMNILLDSEKVFGLVSYHVIPTTVNVTAVEGEQAFRTFSGEDVLVGHSSNATHKGYISSKMNATAMIIGSLSIGNIATIFVDSILEPPVSLLDTAIAMNKTNLATLISAYSPSPSTTVVKDLTVFVPSETAIQTLFDQCNGTIQGLDEDAITAIVENHIFVGSRIYASQFNNVTALPPIIMPNNVTLPVTAISPTEISIGNANVTGPQFLFIGGVGHEINSVLVPEGLVVCKESEVE